MQQRNFVLFMVLSFLILISWVWVQSKIWPRKTKPPSEDHAKKADLPRLGPTAAANLLANRGLPVGGLLDGIRLAKDLQFPPEPRPVLRWQDLSAEGQSKILLLLPPPLPATLGALAQWYPRGTKITPEP